MDAPKCRLCGKSHWSVCASNAASNAVLASNKVHLTSIPASNKIPVPVTNKQRWSKEKYNAYMRDYMRKHRGQRAGEVVAAGESGSVSGESAGLDAEKAC